MSPSSSSKRWSLFMTEKYDQILTYWFGELKTSESFPIENASLWFDGGEEVNQYITDTFSSDLELAKKGQCDSWTQTPRGRLALIVLLDQFSRNIYKGSPKAFEQDSKALQLALHGLRKEDDKKLFPVERTFFYLPLEHSEALPIQEECVRLFKELADEVSPAIELPMRNALDYAIRHYDIIKRFDRFPHRNAVLGRKSTQEEVEFLKGPDSSF